MLLVQTHHVSSHPDEERLGYFLKDWEGLRGYRLSKFYCTNHVVRQWWFLNKDVCGEELNQDLESAMWRRWWDYLYSPACGQHGHIPFSVSDHPIRDSKEMIPRPFNVSSEDWYAEMVKIIKDDLHCWEDWRKWEEFWSHTRARGNDKPS